MKKEEIKKMSLDDIRDIIEKNNDCCYEDEVSYTVEELKALVHRALDLGCVYQDIDTADDDYTGYIYYIVYSISKENFRIYNFTLQVNRYTECEKLIETNDFDQFLETFLDFTWRQEEYIKDYLKFFLNMLVNFSHEGLLLGKDFQYNEINTQKTNSYAITLKNGTIIPY